MKNIMYEDGPAQLWVGPKNSQILLERGKPVPVDDKIAESLLKKSMFKEAVSGSQGSGSSKKTKEG